MEPGRSPGDWSCFGPEVHPCTQPVFTSFSPSSSPRRAPCRRSQRRRAHPISHPRCASCSRRKVRSPASWWLRSDPRPSRDVRRRRPHARPVRRARGVASAQLAFIASQAPPPAKLTRRAQPAVVATSAAARSPQALFSVCVWQAIREHVASSVIPIWSATAKAAAPPDRCAETRSAAAVASAWSLVGRRRPARAMLASRVSGVSPARRISLSMGPLARSRQRVTAATAGRHGVMALGRAPARRMTRAPSTAAAHPAAPDRRANPT
jgi:hypothetical protein